MHAAARVARAALVALTACVVLAAAGGAGVLAKRHLDAPLPVVTASIRATASWMPAPGQAEPIPTAADGSLALAAVAGGADTVLLSTGADVVRPIASVAKTMTALVVLELHPLVPGEPGPTLVMTAQDVADYHAIAAAGGSFAPVELGERLSERDLLLGLMLPSANNLALTLARWVDGSVAAFVHRLNLRAAALGMAHTHFADPDGLSVSTESTASDLLLLGEAAAADDALVSVVSTSRATLPDGTVVNNLDTLLGQVPGWIGVKTGWTPAAGGCLLFAARRVFSPGAPPLTIVGAVLGQPPDGSVDRAHPELGGAFGIASEAATAAFLSYTAVRVGPSTIPVSGRIFAAWGAASKLGVSGPDRVLLLHVGETLIVTATPTPVPVPAIAGAPAGTVTVSRGGTPLGSWRLTVVSRLPAPSPWWRLLHD